MKLSSCPGCFRWPKSRKSTSCRAHRWCCDRTAALGRRSSSPHCQGQWCTRSRWFRWRTPRRSGQQSPSSRIQPWVSWCRQPARACLRCNRGLAKTLACLFGSVATIAAIAYMIVSSKLKSRLNYRVFHRFESGCLRPGRGQHIGWTDPVHVA